MWVKTGPCIRPSQKVRLVIWVAQEGERALLPGGSSDCCRLQEKGKECACLCMQTTVRCTHSKCRVSIPNLSISSTKRIPIFGPISVQDDVLLRADYYSLHQHSKFQVFEEWVGVEVTHVPRMPVQYVS